MEKMNKILKIAALALMLLLSIEFVYGPFLKPPDFPMWKKADNLPLAGIGTSWIGLGRPETVTERGLAWDQITYQVAADDPRYPTGGTFYVDYTWDINSEQENKFFTIYQGDLPPRTVPSDELILRMPAGTFYTVGVYRVRLASVESKVVAIDRFWLNDQADLTHPVRGRRFNDFPYWERVGQADDKVDQNVSLTFKRIATWGPDWEAGHPPMLEFELINQTDSIFYCPDCMRIDYLCDGEWYKVYGNRVCHLVAAREETVPGLPYIRQRPIECPQVLDHPGTYRYYWKDVGYCEFQVV